MKVIWPFCLSERLTREGYQVETCADGEHGLIQAASGNFEMAILDIMLPGRSGFDICRELRHRGIDLPILMLTARGGVTDRVTGFKLGADDYLAKPFEVRSCWRASRPCCAAPGPRTSWRTRYSASKI